MGVLPRAITLSGPRRVLPLELVISAAYRHLREALASAPKTWVVTGVAGFIGSNLLEDLLGLGQTVVGIDNFSTGHRANLDEVLANPLRPAARFRMVEGDIRDLQTCRAACEGADYVLHHAALGSVPWSMDDPLRTNAVNVDGFINVLVAAKDAGVKRVVYASSSAVYGDTVYYPQIENSLGRPLSPYAASKSTDEIYAIAFQMSYGLQSIGLRYFNVFGRRQDPAGAYAAVIPRWIASLLRGERCRIFGDGETTRDFCYIANVLQANLLAATVTDANATCQAYNVACAESVTLNQLFHMMRSRLVLKDARFSGAVPQYDPFRPGDIRYSGASIDKARQMLGFNPTHDVDAGLAEALDWYVERALAGTVPIAGSSLRHSISASHRQTQIAAPPFTFPA
ncbi:MAG TPA: SDR family oxidoreductase [Gemmatimonadaceae bacterium]|nr:SDR family oxidoreductase [Gemmatimonadaceae bacterium]